LLTIFFYIGDMAREAIKEAFAEIEKHTCIQFSPRKEEPDYVEIIDGSG